MAKPTPTDIVEAIGIIERDEWIDPLGLAPTYWSCEIFNPENRYISDGIAWTPGTAMAMAWIAYWSPDALCAGYVDDDLPLIVPEGWPSSHRRPSSRACLGCPRHAMAGDDHRDAHRPRAVAPRTTGGTTTHAHEGQATANWKIRGFRRIRPSVPLRPLSLRRR
jgi:hypothetical protein